MESYPSPSRQWGDVLGMSDDDQSLHVQAGAGIGAASIFLGNGNSQTQHGVSDPNILDIFVQVNESTVMECLDKNSQFTCTALPDL